MLAPNATRLWRSVRIGAHDECWVWTGSTSGRGYGKMKDADDGRLKGAHRISFEVAHGPIPDGMFVLHSCDNPSCVNPRHLRTGTQKENVRDMIERGRRLRREVTHCRRGHEFNERNLGYRKNGYKRCMECGRIYGRTYWRTKNAEPKTYEPKT